MPDRAEQHDDERRRWSAAACDRLSAEHLRGLAVAVTDIPSPTGGEAPLARYLAEAMALAGIEASAQPLDANQANAVGRLRGDGSGPDLMLYAPIDTLTVGEESADLPWIGPRLRPDMRPAARVDGDLVIGLGASNPKGHAACVLAAAQALAAAEIPWRGDLVFAFGAGGMPTNARAESARRNTGQGVGCSFLLEQGWWTDFAVIAKPGWSVSAEEVGLCWFELRVNGIHTYVGSRHRLPYSNPIVSAAQVIERLERWLVDYARAHTRDTVAPQGIVGAVEGGWPHLVAVTPAACRLLVDLRIGPSTTPMQAKREVAALIERLRRDLPELSLGWDMVLAIPGTRTDPRSWVVRSAVQAWESIESRAHAPVVGNSGATDANILRGRGIPTARVGMPKVTTAPFEVDFAMGMNTVDLREMDRLSRLLIQVAVDTATRKRSEVGL